jgi:hypothetical protein
MDAALERKNAAFIAHLPHRQHDSDWILRFPAPRLSPELLQLAVSGQGLEPRQRRAIPSKWQPFIVTLQEVSNRLYRAADDDGVALERMVVVGSIAKGTAVSPEVADLDVVLVFKDFQPRGGAEHDDHLHWLRTVLQRQPARPADIISERGFYFRASSTVESHSLGVASIGRTGAAVPTSSTDSASKREAKYVHIERATGPSIDLLVGGNLPAGRRACDVFRADNHEDWVYWSASCAPQGDEYVRGQPTIVLNAIRALKAWRDALEIQKGKFRPSSFLLELLCISAYQHGYARTAPQVFWHAMQTIASSATDLKITWNAGSRDYDLSMVPASMLSWRPLVLDPIKPWNNVVRAANLKLARRVAVMALSLRRSSSPGVSGTARSRLTSLVATMSNGMRLTAGPFLGSIHQDDDPYLGTFGNSDQDDDPYLGTFDDSDQDNDPYLGSLD